MTNALMQQLAHHMLIAEIKFWLVIAIFAIPPWIAAIKFWEWVDDQKRRWYDTNELREPKL